MSSPVVRVFRTTRRRSRRRSSTQWVQRQIESEIKRAAEQERKRQLEEKRIRAEQERQRQLEEKRIQAEQERQRKLAEKKRLEEEIRRRQEQVKKQWEETQRAQISFQNFADRNIKENIQQQLDEIREIFIRFDNIYGSRYYQNVFSESEQETKELKKINQMSSDLHNHINNLLLSEKSTNHDTIEILEKKLRKWEAELDNIRAWGNKIDTAVEENNKVMSSQISEEIGSIAFNEAEKQTESENEKNDIENYNVLLSNITSTLDILSETKDLPDEYKMRIEASKKQLNTLRNIQMLRNFRSLTLTPLKAAVDSFSLEHEQKLAEYEGLRMEYEELCSIHGTPPLDTKYSAEAIPFLKNEISKIEQELDREDEQEYIHQCLDEVMSDMGYEVIGHRNVNKKSGKKFTNDLYSFSDGTAVNITRSSDGMISMEFAGLDTVDRVPDETEKYLLAQEAASFCEKQKEIEERLEEKGVVVGERISLLPPDGAYAQIINISDYELDKVPARFEAQKKSNSAVSRQMTGE